MRLIVTIERFSGEDFEGGRLRNWLNLLAINGQQMLHIFLLEIACHHYGLW